MARFVEPARFLEQEATRPDKRGGGGGCHEDGKGRYHV